MPVNHNRPQSGMFDSHGDGHPPRTAFLAHTRCEPETAPDGPQDGPELTPGPDGPEDTPAAL